MAEFSEFEILDAYEDWHDEWIKENAMKPELYQAWREGWKNGLRYGIPPRLQDNKKEG